MAAISMLNPKAEVARAGQALAVNMGGARGIQVGVLMVSYLSW